MSSSEDSENEDFTSPLPARSELDERRHIGYPEYSVWKRRRPEIVSTKGKYFVQKRHHPEEVFDDYVYANMDLDLDTKKAALLVSPSVVSLVSLRGGNEVFMASGTILESTQEVDGKYINTILTSASLLDSSGGDCVTVKVYLYDGLDFDASVVAYDPHYNLALISIKSEAALPTATLRCLDDTYEDSRRGDKFGIRPHRDSDSFKICPGEMVIALGRGVRDSYLMVAPGQYSLEECTYDCKELMRATCKISKCGIGGPLINYHGEVIGLNFYDGFCTPFVPTNMVSKFLEHFKKHGRFRRLLHGIEGMNLYEARIKIIAMVVPKFQDCFKGVVVRKIVPGSSADSAGLRRNDVIVQCSGNIVTSWFEFFGQMWDKTGESVELSVIRKRTDGILKLSMVVADETSPDKFYSWPVPKEARGFVKRMRTLKLKKNNLISRGSILF